MMVPAPGLFSMMMVAPRSFAIACARVRAITWVPPPGAKGTTILMVLSGYRAKASLTGSAEISAHAASANSQNALRADQHDIQIHSRKARLVMRRGMDRYA